MQPRFHLKGILLYSIISVFCHVALKSSSFVFNYKLRHLKAHYTEYVHPTKMDGGAGVIFGHASSVAPGTAMLNRWLIGPPLLSLD